MLLPAFQYGPWTTVRGRAKRLAARVKRGENFTKLMLAEGLLDPTKHPGGISINGIAQGKAPHFHAMQPWLELWFQLFDLRDDPQVPTAIEDQVFTESLETVWGVLGLMSSDNQPWMYLAPQRSRFLDAALNHWSELDSVGSLYLSAGMHNPLWWHVNNLAYALAKLGVPNERLNRPLSTEGPHGMLKYATHRN